MELIWNRHDPVCSRRFQCCRDNRTVMLKTKCPFDLDAGSALQLDAVPLQAEDFLSPKAGIESNHAKWI